MVEQKEYWLLYDGDCRLCLGMVERWRGALERRGFGLAALQEDWVRARLDLPEEELLREMRVLSGAGQTRGGASALVFIWSRIWWCWPLWALAQLPGVHSLLDAVYRWIAAHRACLPGSCSLHARPNRARRGAAAFGWAPLLTLLILALSLEYTTAEPWVLMWTLALTLLVGSKWWALWRSWTRGAVIGLKGCLAYLLLWPGMDVTPFTGDANRAAKPATSAWLAAGSKTGAGVALIWAAAPQITDPLLAGWCGMVGMILVLHFGSFHLIALAWQSAGVPARPLMDAPIRSTSLSEFWSGRWNRGFNDLIHLLLFKPSHRYLGVPGAVMLAFLVSGVLHDLVISVPAGAAHGLPTAYFLLQGLGVLLERSNIGRKVNLSQGITGWCYMVLVTAAPLPLLFHEPFVLVVIHPFLQAIGAA